MLVNFKNISNNDRRECQRNVLAYLNTVNDATLLHLMANVKPLNRAGCLLYHHAKYLIIDAVNELKARGVVLSNFGVFGRKTCIYYKVKP